MHKNQECRIREKEANEFAADILMPENEVIRLYEAVCSKTALEKIEYIATRFKVSYDAIFIRMINLGLGHY